MRGKARGFKLHVSYSEVGTANLTFSSSSVFKRFLSCYEHKRYTQRFFFSFIKCYLSHPIFCCTFCGNFWKARKTFQFLKMIYGSYSSSYFNLFFIYAVAPDTCKYIPFGRCFHCTWKINRFSKSLQVVNIENAGFLKSKIWFSPFKTRLVRVFCFCLVTQCSFTALCD